MDRRRTRAIALDPQAVFGRTIRDGVDAEHYHIISNIPHAQEWGLRTLSIIIARRPDDDLAGAVDARRVRLVRGGDGGGGRRELDLAERRLVAGGDDVGLDARTDVEDQVVVDERGVDRCARGVDANIVGGGGPGRHERERLAVDRGVAGVGGYKLELVIQRAVDDLREDAAILLLWHGRGAGGGSEEEGGEDAGGLHDCGFGGGALDYVSGL
ncbi:hypothetical protein BZA05DRAFT_216465 [Tricharina praecox]|uniref:uncharacterized protein n=1 Tax=Tricharina praecox TaxID=43433 RepID=UPI002220E4A3|nr:uncharacterized protein BZA05DRAFT_216465 [Tricharina praecox]KAI5855720.1 hypothetical protein BZA05DRAFT_216465 [Tricharina praecox]